MILAAVYTMVGYHLFLVERIAGFTLTGPLMETTSYPGLLVSVYVWPLAIAFLTLLLLSCSALLFIAPVILLADNLLELTLPSLNTLQTLA